MDFLNNLFESENNPKTIAASISKELYSSEMHLQNLFDGHFNLQPILEKNKIFSNNIQKLNVELQEIYSSIEKNLNIQLEQYESEFVTYNNSTGKLNLELKILQEVIKFATSVNEFKNLLDHKEYYKCSMLYVENYEKLHDLRHLAEIKIFDELIKEFVILHEKLLFDISEQWETFLTVKEENNDISLEINLNDVKYKSEIIKSIFLMEDDMIERKFFALIKNTVILPIITKECTITNKLENNIAYLTIKLHRKNKEKPVYTTVFDRIIKIIKFIYDYLDVSLPDDTTLIGKLGLSIAESVFTSLIENCLSDIKAEELQEIYEKSNEFETILKNMNFISTNFTTLIDYAKNINLVLDNKICQSHMDKARNLMKKDLYATVSADEVSIKNISILPTKVANTLFNAFKLTNDQQITLTACQISKSVDDLMDFINSLVLDIRQSEEGYGIRLIYTIRNIFELYTCIVPLLHEKFLKTIPHQVAVFHNNCLHMAFRLVQLGIECRTEWKPVFQDHFLIFLEEAVEVRKIGVQTLENFVTNQRSYIVYILRDSGLAVLSETPKLQSGTEKSLRQCIRQLELLQSAWQPVLAGHVYENVIGFLVDAFTDEIVHLLLQVEDISSDTAQELVNIFSIVIERVPSIFNDPNEVYRICKRWSRFQEFLKVLSGSLNDISHRWADGLGPLAVELTADQVKHLIRALFQNTDRRANVLAKIK